MEMMKKELTMEEMEKAGGAMWLLDYIRDKVEDIFAPAPETKPQVFPTTWINT